MHRLVTVFATIVLVGSGILASSPVDARDGRHSHHRHGGARLSVGVHFGFPLYAPFYYPPPYYYRYYPYPPAVYVTPAAPPVYVERGDLTEPAEIPPPAVPRSMQPAPAGYWYFCPDSNTYYPYVRDCPSEWQRVVPYPPSVGR
jgi:hypothetical protein